MSSFESTPNLNNSEEKKIGKKSLELEKLNRMAENSTDPEIKERMIAKAGNFEQKLDELEIKSGLSKEDIEMSYEKLTEAIKEGGNINKMIERLANDLSEEDKNEFFKAIKEGTTENIVEIFKNANPKRLLVVTALILALTTGAIGSSVDIAGAESIPGNKIELEQQIKNPGQAWNYLLKAGKGNTASALEKIKKSMHLKGKGLQGVLNVLNSGKVPMGVAEYAKSLGLNYYNLDEEHKENAKNQFEKYLQESGIDEYLQLANNLKQNNKVDRLIEETKKIEDGLKSSLVKQFESELNTSRDVLLMGWNALRMKYLELGYSPQEVAEIMVKNMEQSVEEYSGQ